MTTEQQAADEPRSQAARLDQFLGWLLPTIVGFAVLKGVAGLAFADAPTLGTTLILVVYAALLWLARSLARRDRVRAAVVATCAGLLAASIGVVLLQPALYPTLTIVSLLAAAVALPYIGGRRLIRLLVGCWLVTILVAVLGQTLTDQAAIPAWFAGLFHTSALAAAAALVLLLLWQFSDRLSEALGRLEAQRERLHVTLHSIGDGVIATDTAGTVTLLNPIAEALTGWPRDEAVGRPFREVFPIISEVTRAPAVDPIATVLSTGARVGLANHTVLVARDGVERSIADSAAPIRDHGNRLHGVVVVFHDVTERQRAERDQRLLVAAGAALAGSLEAQVVAQRLTDLATPDLADLCIVDLLSEDGSIQRPAAAHRDPAQARFVVRGSAPRYPPRLDAPVGVGKVLRTGKSEFYPVVPEGMLNTLAQDAEHLQLLRGLGYRFLSRRAAGGPRAHARRPLVRAGRGRPALHDAPIWPWPRNWPGGRPWRSTMPTLHGRATGARRGRGCPSAADHPGRGRRGAGRIARRRGDAGDHHAPGRAAPGRLGGRLVARRGAGRAARAPAGRPGPSRSDVARPCWMRSTGTASPPIASAGSAECWARASRSSSWRSMTTIFSAWPAIRSICGCCGRWGRVRT